MDTIPTELLNMPLRDWQLNITTLAIAAMLLGRAYKSLRAGGGLMGLWRGIIYGDSAAPKPTTTTEPKADS